MAHQGRSRSPSNPSRWPETTDHVVDAAHHPEVAIGINGRAPSTGKKYNAEASAPLIGLPCSSCGSARDHREPCASFPAKGRRTRQIPPLQSHGRGRCGLRCPTNIGGDALAGAGSRTTRLGGGAAGRGAWISPSRRRFRCHQGGRDRAKRPMSRSPPDTRIRLRGLIASPTVPGCAQAAMS